ncbi:hypothetical protein CAOG_02715 [Capsaspora owczarzaki ATCC 30864]|nr:hypothetical protein CAOG_02715 [Capsaspora owczarzaki ATCC 30864]|eukprot:XP_004349465.1 hypothetical protein CAOG_02715 [Capsaspora owczarzaki ATCC 30864]
MSIVRVAGLDQFRAAAETAKAANAGRLFALFCGSKDPATGNSWCPDCVASEPHIMKEFGKQTDATLIYCTVGERAEWKDSNNVFRKAADLRVACVPTLLEVDTKRRLNDAQCQDPKLVAMFFEEED